MEGQYDIEFFKDRIQDECVWRQTETFLYNYLVIITWKTWGASALQINVKPLTTDISLR